MANEGIVHIVNLSKYCWPNQNQQFFRKLTICFDFFVPQYLYAVILENPPQHIVIFDYMFMWVCFMFQVN